MEELDYGGEREDKGANSTLAHRRLRHHGRGTLNLKVTVTTSEGRVQRVLFVFTV